MIIALGIMMVFGILGGTLVLYSTSNEKSSHRSEATLEAFQLAEAGMGQALSILANPANNASLISQSLLPSTEATATVDTSLGGGRTSSWYAVFTQTGIAGGSWKVVGIGQVPSPSAPGQTVVRRVHAYVSAGASNSQPLSNDAWHFIYAKRTGDPSGCDMTITNNSNVNSSIYVVGNFCIQNPSSILGPQTATSPAVFLYVEGRLNKDKQVTVGSSPKPLTAVGLVGGCKNNSDGSGALFQPCTNTQKVFPDSTTTFTKVIAPTADFAGWYPWAKPGPKFPCSTSTGTPPVFDNEPLATATKNNSIPTVVDLTPPATAYSCVMSDGSGSITWNPATKKLTVSGTMYIDGSVTSTSSPVDYDGSAALYVSGTFLVKNASLCAIVSGSGCDTAAWSVAANPDILLVSAEQKGTGGASPQDQVAAGDSIEIKTSQFQGALYGVYNVEMDTSSQMQGPIVSDSTIVSQTGGSPFPIFVNVPFGTPGNPIVNFTLYTPLNEQECIPSTC